MYYTSIFIAGHFRDAAWRIPPVVAIKPLENMATDSDPPTLAQSPIIGN